MSEEKKGEVISQNSNELSGMGMSEPYNSAEDRSLLYSDVDAKRKRFRFTIGAKLILSFGFVLIIIIVLSAVSYMNILKQQRTSALEEHTYEVIYMLEELISLLKDAETGQRGYIITGKEEYLEPYNNAVLLIDVTVRDLKESSSDFKDIKIHINQLEILIAEKISELQETIRLRKEDGFQAALEVVLTDQGKKIMDTIRVEIDEIKNHEYELLEMRHNETQVSVSNTKRSIIVGAILAFVFSVFIIYFITSSINRSLQIVIKRIKEIAMAGGNLTAGIYIKSNDEFGDLASSFNLMLSTLGVLIGRTRFAGLQIISTSSQILSSSQEHAASASEQASQITEVTSAVNELAASAQQVSQSANEVSKVSNEAVKTAEVGAKSVVNAVNSMNRINESGKDMAKKIEALGKKSQKISDILDLLDDIAEQTNLLALNAAIEAAKAGEVGKGFSVVADEIRKLADSSRKASKGISNIILEIQADTQETVRGMEKNSTLIEDGNALASIAGSAISEITAAMEEAARSVKQIAIAAQQQTTGASQISQSMTQISNVVTQGVAGTEQSIRSAKNLAAMAEQLKASIAQFKTRETRSYGHEEEN